MTLRTVVLSFSLIAFAGAAYANEQKSQSQQSQNQQSQSQQSQSQQQPQAEQKGSQAASGGTQQSGQSMQSGSQQQSQGQQQGSQAASGGTQQSKQSQQSGNTISAERLQDAKVVDKNGRDLGQIEEVVIDLNKNRVHAVVLSFGGFLGMGDKQFAFPMSELKPARGDNQFTVNVNKERLENAEGFAKGQLPGMDDGYWARVGQQGQQKGQQKGQQAKGGQGQKMNLVQASKIIGSEVDAKGGQQIGEIRDLLISRSDGQLRQVVIGLKDGGGQATVPAKGLAAGTGDTLVLGMSADEVRAQAKQTQGQQRRGAVGGTVGIPPATQDRATGSGNR